MNAPRHINDPRPGFFLVRKVRRGPLVPARIWRPCRCTITEGEHPWRDTCDRFPGLAAEIDGFPVEIDRVWHYGKEIEETEWWRMTLKDDNSINPDKPVELRDMKPIF